MRVPPERVHRVFNHPWGDKPANNKETYGLSTLGAGSDLSRTLFFLITCTTCFTRLLTSFRRYIQRLVSMSIADGLASTNLPLLYILAIYLHIYKGDITEITCDNACRGHYGTSAWPRSMHEPSTHCDYSSMKRWSPAVRASRITQTKPWRLRDVGLLPRIEIFSFKKMDLKM